jgi:uncharacterized protein (TIGR03067 family)
MMRKLLGLATVLCLVALQSQAADEKKADKTDKDKLQGTWVASSIEFMGKTLPVPEGKEATFTFDGDKVKIHDPDKKKDENGTYKIDEKKDPKEIDLTGPKDDNPKETETLKGLYKLDGETLKIAFSEKGPKGDRPTKFDDKNVIMTFKKKK